MSSAMTASEIIDQLGGTAEVARLCEVQPPSVSEWRVNGIPRARLMYLRAIRPDVFQSSTDGTDGTDGAEETQAA